MMLLRTMKNRTAWWCALVVLLSSEVLAQSSNYDLNPEVGNGSAVTAGQQMRGVTSFLRDGISQQVGRSLAPGYYSRSAANNMPVSTGLAAGDAGRTLNVWANYSYAEQDNREDAINTDTNAHYLNVGLDSLVTDRVVVGGVVGYEELHTDSDPDADALLFGPVKTSTNLDQKAWTYSLYTGYKFSDNLTLDASYSYTPHIDIDQRTVTATTTLDSEQDNARHAFAVNLNRYWVASAYKVEAHVGYLYAKEKQEHYSVIDRATGKPATFVPNGQSPDDTSIGQFNARSRVTWLMGNFEPYVGVAYEYDHNGADENMHTVNKLLAKDDRLHYDRSGFVLNGGFDYYVGDAGNLSFDLSTVEGREKEGTHALVLGYRHSF